MFFGGIVVNVVVMVEEEGVVLLKSGVVVGVVDVEVVDVVLVVVDGCGDSVVDGGEESCVKTVGVV